MKVRNEIEIPQSAIDEATKKEIKSFKAKLVSAEKKISDRERKIRGLEADLESKKRELKGLKKLRDAVQVFYDMGHEAGYDDGAGY